MGVVVGCLLAGAIINVLVAWGFAWSGNTMDLPAVEANKSRGDGFDTWWVVQRNGLGRTHVRVIWMDKGFVTEVLPESSGGDPDLLIPYWMNTDFPTDTNSGGHLRGGNAYGVPFRSFWWEESSDVIGTGLLPVRASGVRLRARGIARSIGYRKSGLVPESLPIRPIWPGLITNTIIYASASWLLLGLPFSIRRRRRAKRNKCPDCGYDLRGADHGKCPECGEAVVSKRRQPNSRTPKQVAD